MNFPWKISRNEINHQSSHEEVDVLIDLNRYPIKPGFGGRHYKPGDVMMIISIGEVIFLSRYKNVDKSKPQWNFF